MGVSFASYEIARSGLFVNERGLNVTGHNISNVNTPGYVRQQAMISTGPYQSEMNRTGMFQLGLGADIQQIRQIRHTFLDNIYRQESTTAGYWEARSKTYQDVQSVLGEPMGAGLQNIMNQFWDSWQELSKSPDSLTVRALVRQRGEAFVYQVNHLGKQLDKLQEDLNSEIKVRINEINNITENIASLNVNILKTEVSGDTANDYRDQRNTLVDRLSKLCNAEVTEMQDGQLTISLGGYFLVTKGESFKLAAVESKPGEQFVVPKLAGTNIEVPVHSGILKGLLESRGEVNGAVGSRENGTPNNKVDVVFAVDTTMSNAELDQVRNNISKYVDGLKKSGLDYNLKLITYGNTPATSASYGSSSAALTALAGAIPSTTGTTGAGNFGDVVSSLGDPATGLNPSLAFRSDAVRHAIVFTSESLNGDATTPVTDASSYIDSLNKLGIKVSVATDNANFNSGDPTELGWNSITNGTGGTLHDLSDTNLMTTASDGTIQVVNQEMSVFEGTNNIISDLRKQLNAMVNIMVREVNRVHSNGTTLTGAPGGNFFAALNSANPMELGNLKLDDSLLTSNGLNNIVASTGGKSGDNTIALKIANMRHNSLLGKIGESVSIDDFYRSIILDVGNNGNDAVRISESQQKLVQSADNYRQSITGVSMDEEMANMMKYKFAYNAASRALNVVDEMVKTIIERMGS